MAELLFIRVLNMSLTGSLVILAVLMIRVFLRKVPRIFSYCLWAVVLFRLLCPISFTAEFSPLTALPAPVTEQGRIEYIPEDILQYQQSGVEPVIPETGAITPITNQDTFTGKESLSKVEFLLRAASEIWLAGVLILTLYSVLTLVRLMKKLKNTSWERDNIYITETISTPFVIGLVRPKIYLPSTLNRDEMRYILLHEQIHLKRGDHIVKMVSFVALCLHWFNPLVWAAFFLSGKDMEMSCDEAVIRKIGSSVKKEYTTSLLCLSTGKRIVNGIPLAFGEGDTGSRIKNVLRYRKPAARAAGIVAVICAAAAVVLLANPSKPADDGENMSYETLYGVVTDMGSKDSPHPVLVCPIAGILEIPAAETIDTYFEPGDTRDPHELLPGDLVAVTFSPEKNADIAGTLAELQASQSLLIAERLMIVWQGISLEYLQEEVTYPSLLPYNMRFTFPGGVIPDISSAAVGDILSIYQEEREVETYLTQVPESESSRLIVSTPILAIEENEYGGKMITIEITDSEAAQILSGFGFATRFALGADETDGNSTNTDRADTDKTSGADTTAAATGMDGKEQLPQSGGSMTGDGLYRISIQSISRSARMIDRYVSSYDSPYDGTESLAFADNCVFQVNSSMETLDYEEVSFDTFAELISEGSDQRNIPCLLTLEDGLIVEAALDSALLHCGISFDSDIPQSHLYDYLLENEGADAFDTYYSLVGTESADIADSAGDEIMEIYTGNIGDGDSGIVLFKNAAGDLLCTQDAHISRAGWNNIYLGEKDGVPFIMNVYVEDRWDFGGYGYWVYRLDEKGGIKLIAGSRFDFRLGDDAQTYDDDLFREWVSNMTAWLENSHLILSSQEGELRTEKVSETDRYNYDTLSLKDREL